MQTHGGDAAEKAVTSAERRIHAFVMIDWNKNGLYDHPLSIMSQYADTITTDRSLRGSAPEEILLIEGSAAAEMTMSVFGEYDGLSFDAIFSPYQGNSPFYHQDIIGAEIQYQLGIDTVLGTVWYKQFIGTVRTITPNRETGTAEITALDRAEQLRRPIHFPPWALLEHLRGRKRVQAQLANSQWFIDHCLRWCNVSPTPYRHPTREENGLADDDVTGPQLWITGTGSWLPTVGWLDNWNVQEFPKTETTGVQMYDDQGAIHPDSPEPETIPMNFAAVGSNADDTLKYWGVDRANQSDLGIQILGFTLITRGINDTYWETASAHDVLRVRIGNKRVIKITLQSGQIWTDWVDEHTGVTISSEWVDIPTTGDYHQVVAMWDAFNPAGSKAYLKVGTNSTGDWDIVSSPRTWVVREEDLKGLCEVKHKVALQDVFWTSTNYLGFGVSSMLNWAQRDAKYVAVLDQGINRLSFTPTRQYDDAWNVISDIASAEFGSVFWDEDGVFRFWNFNRIRDLQNTVVRTLTLDDVSGLQISHTLDSVRNIWSAQQDKKIAFQTTTYNSSNVDEFYVEGVTREKFRIWSDDIVCMNPGKSTQYSTNPSAGFPLWNDTLDHGYVVQYEVDPDVWEEDDTRFGVDIYTYFDAFGNYVVDIWNGWSENIRLATDSGQPAFRVGGTGLKSLPSQATVTKDLASIERFGARNYGLSGPWIQEYTNFDGMVETLMERTSESAPTTDDITIAGDPRLQLGDTLRIADPDGFGEKFDVQIYGISRTFSRDDGLKDTLTVEMVRPPINGLWDSAQYGLWDTSFIWS